MTRSIHEHQWVYFGDLALTVSRKETDVSLRRLEYCIKCSTARVQFPSGWYTMAGDATTEFLKQFDGESPGRVFKIPPKGFRPRPPKASPRRLGKTLADISTQPMPSALLKKK